MQFIVLGKATQVTLGTLASGVMDSMITGCTPLSGHSTAEVCN